MVETWAAASWRFHRRRHNKPESDQQHTDVVLHGEYLVLRLLAGFRAQVAAKLRQFQQDAPIACVPSRFLYRINKEEFVL